MIVDGLPALDDFCTGLFVVNKNRNIIFCNDYIRNLNGLSREPLINKPLSACFTKASNIFIDSYIFPILLNELVVQESQLNWIGKDGKAISVVANVRLGQEGVSYWSLSVCTNRDKLYSELIKAKNKLEAQSKELFHLATTDPLTGLLNRRELISRADKIVQLIARKLSTFALLCIDVDFFKGVNDTYGHQTGDKVLKRLAQILTEERRVNDLVARIGGEEFVLVLPTMHKKDAFLFAEKLRKKVEEQLIDDFSITVSIGLVISDIEGKKPFEELLDLADQALYEAKKTGRNKTSIARY